MQRRAARALLIAEQAVLLINGYDPARPHAGSWWITPGGGVEDGELVRVAAAREVREETGLELAPEDFGPVIATRVARFEFEHQEYQQSESFFAVHVKLFKPTACGWDELERRSLSRHRWWELADLATTDETVYPHELAEVVRAVLAGKISEPMRLSEVTPQ